MANQTPEQLTSEIQQILSSGNLHQLKQILPSGQFENLNCTDKSKISLLFYNFGTKAIQEASKIDNLENALVALMKAHEFDPENEGVCFTIAQAYLRMRLMNPDEEYAYQAHEYLTKAENILRYAGKKMPLDSLWEWAVCLYFIAKESGEAVDYKCSVDKFFEAHALGLETADFLNEYGTALGEFGVIIGNHDCIIEAIHLLERSLKINSALPSSWLRLACAYKILYVTTGNVEYFEKADQSFVGAARLDADSLTLWLNWGQLLALEGKTIRDPTLLLSSVEKIEKANAINPNDPIIQASLADSLIHLGAITEQIELLKEAKEKLENCLAQVPDSIDMLCLYGHCFVHMGKYFSEKSFIEQAIEKFQQGISRDRKSYILWHGLATAHYAIGELEKNALSFEKAAKFCAQAINLGGELPNYWNDWGVALMKLGDLNNDGQAIAHAVEKFEKAIKTFNQKQKGNPDPDWIYNYGCALDFLGEFEQNPHHYEQAIAVLSHLHDQYPDSPHIRYNLAIALYHFGDATEDEDALERSIEHLQVLINKDAEDDNILNDYGLSCLTLADLYRDTFINPRSFKYFQKAEQAFMQAIACGGTEGNYWLACVYSLQNHLEQGIHFLERAKQAGILPPAEDLLQNVWLDNLKMHPQFKTLI